MSKAVPGYIFVSYAHADHAYVARLRHFLESHGFAVWLDESIANGERWAQTLRDHVDKCAALVVIMSPAAEDSEWVENELHRARQRGKPILPLLLSGEPFFRFGGVQYENVSGGRLPSAAFIDTLAAVAANGVGAATATLLPSVSGVPIERHTMLANGQTVALLTPDARVTWFCYPHPDSPPAFADLLGGASAGYFAVAPADTSSPPAQHYEASTMTAVTRWADLTVTDWLDTRPAGAARSATSLIRVLDGTCPVRIELGPKPRFGQATAVLKIARNGLLVHTGPEVSALHSPGVAWSVTGDMAVGVADLTDTGPLILDFRCGTDDLTPPADISPDVLISTGGQTWRDWAASLTLPTVAPEATLRSALTLRGLWHRPSGAFLASVTTSLPEAVGASRNWDYRYCWIRDGSMSARELVRLGSIEEAHALLRWLDQRVVGTDGHPERLHPLYTLDGRELGLQAEITNAHGHLGSLPIRIGNHADGQIQRDIYGPVVDLVAAVVESRTSRTVLDHEWRLLTAMVEAVSVGWRDTDQGIWECPQRQRHYVHSKVMCWWALRRAIDVVTATGRRDVDAAAWASLASTIRNDVLTHGWNDRLTSFTEAYGSDSLDAATLWIGLSGMIPADDHRFRMTVQAVERHLRRGPTVYRYTWDDGLDGDEGGFHLCTTWLIEAYIHMGRAADAHDLFQQYLGLTGPTGLIPEMYDPRQHLSLGNHPMAYSHLGLIRCASLLAAQTT